MRSEGKLRSPLRSALGGARAALSLGAFVVPVDPRSANMRGAHSGGPPIGFGLGGEARIRSRGNAGGRSNRRSGERGLEEVRLRLLLCRACPGVVAAGGFSGFCSQRCRERRWLTARWRIQQAWGIGCPRVLACGERSGDRGEIRRSMYIRKAHVRKVSDGEFLTWLIASSSCMLTAQFRNFLLFPLVSRYPCPPVFPRASMLPRVSCAVAVAGWLYQACLQRDKARRP